MKRKIVLLLLCVTVTLGIVGCEGRHQTEKQKKPKEQMTEQTVSEDTKISEEQEEEVTHTEKKTESVGEEVQNNNQVTETPKTPQKVQTETTEIEKKSENSNQKSENKPQSTQQPTVTQTPEKPKVEEPTPEPTRATANDCVAVANKVIEYINSYRSTSATKLPGLTVYAEYRSRQLISNFAHDTFDERAAATALQYGTYIDPTLYGITGEPYYAAGAREAIAKAGYVGTIDYVAKSIADLVKNSAGHWAYVGSSEYPYIAVGVTYESDMWYCDIAMARENTDNK